MPIRGAKVLYRFGAWLLETPGSPGNTNPVGALGNSIDCSPGIRFVIIPFFSAQGFGTSQRNP